MDQQLAVDALVGMLGDNGVGVGASVRADMAEIISAVIELADDYPSGDDAAEAVLRGYRDGVQCPGCPEGARPVRAGGPWEGHCPSHWHQGLCEHSLPG
jgi:hypothetical protein